MARGGHGKRRIDSAHSVTLVNRVWRGRAALPEYLFFFLAACNKEPVKNLTGSDSRSGAGWTGSLLFWASGLAPPPLFPTKLRPKQCNLTDQTPTKDWMMEFRTEKNIAHDLLTGKE